VYGLYASVNEEYFRSLGVRTIIGGEFEEALSDAIIPSKPKDVRNAGSASPISLDRLEFVVPDRTGLPPLRQYAHLVLPDGSFRVCGYTEASRGCKHLCRHCPIVPVYNGVFIVRAKSFWPIFASR
jgi:hypothetical protein